MDNNSINEIINKITNTANTIIDVYNKMQVENNNYEHVLDEVLNEYKKQLLSNNSKYMLLDMIISNDDIINNHIFEFMINEYFDVYYIGTLSKDNNIKNFIKGCSIIDKDKLKDIKIELLINQRDIVKFDIVKYIDDNNISNSEANDIIKWFKDNSLTELLLINEIDIEYFNNNKPSNNKYDILDVANIVDSMFTPYTNMMYKYVDSDIIKQVFSHINNIPEIYNVIDSDGYDNIIIEALIRRHIGHRLKYDDRKIIDNIDNIKYLVDGDILSNIPTIIEIITYNPDNPQKGLRFLNSVISVFKIEEVLKNKDIMTFVQDLEVNDELMTTLYSNKYVKQYIYEHVYPKWSLFKRIKYDLLSK